LIGSSSPPKPPKEKAFISGLAGSYDFSLRFFVLILILGLIKDSLGLLSFSYLLLDRPDFLPRDGEFDEFLDDRILLRDYSLRDPFMTSPGCPIMNEGLRL
jgi:hypothetical protein